MDISAGLIVTVIFLVLVAFTISLGVRIVPQGFKFVIQRLGKYHTTLGPGLNLIIPYMDTVAHKVTTKDIVMDIPSQEVITKDNAVIITNAVAYINILFPDKAVYGVDNYEVGIKTLVQTSLRSIIGEMDLDEALSNRNVIRARLKESISDDIADWGIAMKTVEIQDINPSKTMQTAMEEQAAAERKRRATVTTAEGDKTAAILQAEGRFEASKRDASAKIVLAEASQTAIEKVTSAIRDNDLPIVYLLGEKYIEALREVSSSPNSKIVLLPGDLPAAIRGILGTIK